MGFLRLLWIAPQFQSPICVKNTRNVRDTNDVKNTHPDLIPLIGLQTDNRSHETPETVRAHSANRHPSSHLSGASPCTYWVFYWFAASPLELCVLPNRAPKLMSQLFRGKYVVTAKKCYPYQKDHLKNILQFQINVCPP